MFILKCRKRSRDTADENEESVPLTKRINNLNLENDSNSLETFYSNEIAKHISISNGHNPNNGENTNGLEPNSSYNPELGVLENPYYYNNKLLYEMHLQRLRRQNPM